MKRRALLGGLMAVPLLPTAVGAAALFPETGPVFAVVDGANRGVGTYTKVGNRVEVRATIGYVPGGVVITGLPNFYPD